MTNTNELDQLIQQAQARLPGVAVIVEYESNDEGRRLYKQITVVGLPGVGPYPMSSISAAETLRSVIHGTKSY